MDSEFDGSKSKQLWGVTLSHTVLKVTAMQVYKVTLIKTVSP